MVMAVWGNGGGEEDGDGLSRGIYLAGGDDELEEDTSHGEVDLATTVAADQRLGQKRALPAWRIEIGSRAYDTRRSFA